MINLKSAVKMGMFNNNKVSKEVALTASIGALAIIASGILMFLSFGGVKTDELTQTQYLSARSDVFPVTKAVNETAPEETESDVPALIEADETEGSANKDSRVVITRSDNGGLILRSDEDIETISSINDQ